MTPQITSHQEDWIKATAEDLSKYLIDSLRDGMVDLLPTFEEPFANISSAKIGIYISVTEEEEYTGVVPWNDFEKNILNSSPETLERYIPRFEKLIKKMQAEIKAHLE